VNTNVKLKLRGRIRGLRDLTPEIREAQFLTLKKSPNTAMTVITDAGDVD
jgi:hypothetical protein